MQTFSSENPGIPADFLVPSGDGLLGTKGEFALVRRRVGDEALEDGAIREAARRDADVGPAEFEAIFHRYGRPVLSFIFNLIGDRSGAEELAQETFIRAFSNLSSRRPGGSLSTWIFGIAHNVAREAIRQKYRNRRYVGLEPSEMLQILDNQPLPDQSAISRDMMAKIHRAMAGLQEDQRTVFLMKMVHGLRYDEIAEITGASISKLKSDLHRARIDMRRKLRPFFGDATPGLRGES
jgi:RNA polymerase sigma-70 factor, ECF subfamily